MSLWLFIRGKTTERTFTISPQGIATEIGPLKKEISWREIRHASDLGQHILIVVLTGNAFTIPARAFQGSGEQAKFAAQITNWLNAK